MCPIIEEAHLCYATRWDRIPTSASLGRGPSNIEGIADAPGGFSDLSVELLSDAREIPLALTAYAAM